MHLSIIVVEYNSTIKNCISTLEFFQSIEIIIIDNSTKKNNIKFLRGVEYKYIKNTKNNGFAKAANQGARVAKGEYVLFLNPDTIAKPKSIEKMLTFIKDKKNAAVVGCKVLNPDGTLQPSCGNFPTITNILLDRIPIMNKIVRTQLIRQKNYYDTQQQPDWVSGVCFLARKDVFQKLGGFNEEYFMYVEDVDFCYRAKRAGYKIFYTPEAEVMHYDQGRNEERKLNKAKNMRKGFSLFFQQHKTTLDFSLWQAVLTIESVFRLNLKQST